MIIRAFKIEPQIAIKIFSKHNVDQEEIYDVLKNNDPQFRRVGGNQYVAIGKSRSRYVTIFFTYDPEVKEAEITTAYGSDKKQIKWCRKVKK